MSTKIKKLIRILAIATIMTIALSINVFVAGRDAVGDLNRDGVIDENDAIYLLYSQILDGYNIDQPCDYNGDGEINEDDAIFAITRNRGSL